MQLDSVGSDPGICGKNALNARPLPRPLPQDSLLAEGAWFLFVLVCVS